jgi:hypothetical protein
MLFRETVAVYCENHTEQRNMGKLQFIYLFIYLLLLLLFFNSHSGRWSPSRGPLGTAATEWPTVPAPGDYDDGEFGGMKNGRGTQRKPTLAPLCPPQIPVDQTRARTRAAVVGSQRLTARARARSAVAYFSMLLVSRVYSVIW